MEGYNNPISSKNRGGVLAVKILLSGNRGEPRMLSAHCSRVRDSGLFGGLDWTAFPLGFCRILLQRLSLNFFNFFFFFFFYARRVE